MLLLNISVNLWSVAFNSLFILSSTNFYVMWWIFLGIKFSVLFSLSIAICIFRYWNDPTVLRKLGEAMGLPVSGDAVASAETSGQDESDEVRNGNESIVHGTASVGDVEVIGFCITLLVGALWCVAYLF